MILVVVNEDGKRYECYGKTTDELRKVQTVIREKKNALCPECGQPMQVRIYDTGIRTNHFFHIADGGCGYGKGESEEHLFAKIAMRKYLEARADWDGAEFELEHRVILADGSLRIIDLAVFHTDGRKEAHEAQLSTQNLSTFEERTQAYRTLGFTPIWWLGAKNRNARDWCYSECGWVGEIAVEEVPIDYGQETYAIQHDEVS